MRIRWWQQPDIRQRLYREGRLPRLAGGETKTGTFRLNPEQGSTEAWTKVGAESEQWKEINQPSFSNGGSVTNIKNKGIRTNTKGVESRMKLQTLAEAAGWPAGATLLKVKAANLQVYGKQEASKATVIKQGLEGASQKIVEPTFTTAAWQSFAVTEHLTGTESLEASLKSGTRLEVIFECKTTKNPEVNVYYLEVEVEYETAAGEKKTAKGTSTILIPAAGGVVAKMTALATTAVLFKDQAATATKQTAKSTAVIKFTTNGAIAAKGTATGVSLIRFVTAGAQASKIGAAGMSRVLFTATAATQTASAAHTGGVALFRFATNTPSGLNKKATHGETQILFAAHAATAKAGVATATGTSLLSFKTEAVSAQHQASRGQSQIIFSDAGRAVPAKQAAIGTTNVKLSAAAAQASKVTSTGSATVKFSASAASSSSGAAHAAATSLIRFGVNTPSALSKKTANGETRILFNAQAGTAKTGSATAAATASLLFKAQAAPVQKQTVKGQSQVKFSTSGAVAAHLTFNGSAGLIFRQSLGTEVKRSATASATANIRFSAILRAREGRGSESLGLPAIVEPGEREGRTSPFSSAGIVQPVPGRLVP